MIGKIKNKQTKKNTQHSKYQIDLFYLLVHLWTSVGIFIFNHNANYDQQVKDEAVALRGYDKWKEKRGKQQQAGARAASLASWFGAMSFFLIIAVVSLAAGK